MMQRELRDSLVMISADWWKTMGKVVNLKNILHGTTILLCIFADTQRIRNICTFMHIVHLVRKFLTVRVYTFLKFDNAILIQWQAMILRSFRSSRALHYTQHVRNYVQLFAAI